MNRSARNAPGGKTSGAALVIALAASLAVMLSVALLFGYITRVVDQQVFLEQRTQAGLTEESAVAALCMDFRNTQVSDFNDLPEYSIGAMRTTFTLMETDVVTTREVRLARESSGTRAVFPAGKYIFLICESENHLEIDLIDSATLISLEGFPIHLPEKPDVWTAGGIIDDGKPLLIAAFREGKEDIVYTVFKDASTESFPVNLPLWNNYSLVSTGFYDDEPALLISNGRNRAQLVMSASERILFAFSEPGTSPAFFSNGSFYGDIGNLQDSPDSGFRIVDIFSGDFDMDGTEDLFWAGPNSFSFLSGFRGRLYRDTLSEGTLVAWGAIEGTFNLAGRWMLNDGSIVWRKLSWNGFQEYPGIGVLSLDWEGRIESSRGVILGSSDGVLRTASTIPSHSREYCPSGGVLMSDLDGSGTDILSLEEDGLRIFMNPLSGDGLHLSLRVRTDGNKGMILDNMWWISIYGYGDASRVYAGREGAGES
ncbi:MAG: hypothetical protein GQ565_03680 [Candidatus Aegiribacteria sp.]|nr:hypothetical protein [Candidatus Aegiribacteria sp.]